MALHSPCTEHNLAMEGHLADLAWAAGCFFPFSDINYLTFHCLYFLLVKEIKELISSPKALASNSDPGCSLFFLRINPSLLWPIIHAAPAVPLPYLSTRSLRAGAAGWRLPGSRAVSLCPTPNTPWAGPQPGQAHFWVSSCKNSLWQLFVQKAVQTSLCHSRESTGAPALKSKGFWLKQVQQE